ncbi:MAG TPA: PAS domain S-box protein [Xanthobacteraceae bacterium]|jgi:PAS domain S-box-containing protein
MALAIWLIAATTTLLTATAFGWLAHDDVGTAILSAGLTTVAGIPILALLLEWMTAGKAAPAEIASSQRERIAAQLAEATAALAAERNERRTIALALEQHEQRERMFSAAMEQATFPIITTTLDGTITGWNPAAERLYRYTAAEAIGRNVSIIVPPDRRGEQSAMIERSLASEPVENFETVRSAKGGRRIAVSLSIRPITSASGVIVGLAKITRDITEEKFAEEKFRLAVESCPSGMLMVDRAGKVVLVNTEIERLFGYGREELIGQPVDILVPIRLHDPCAPPCDGFRPRPETIQGASARRELCGRRKDGTEFPVELVLNSIHTDEGLLVLGTVVDISERKRLERLKDEFVSTVSHELRTPLTSISGSLGLLIGGATGTLPDSAARLLAIAQTNSQRLVRLVNDILDIEKMESNQIAFNFTRLDARALVEQAIEANRGFADGYGVRIRLDAVSVAGEVHADADRLAQVVTNLLSNAIKFSPRDSEVVAAVEQHHDRVRISVRDHGAGIPADFRPHVFEKFAQADATDARRKGGTGLGLSIVKQIVTRLGGTVGFEDAPGGGTVFQVDLAGREQVAGREIDPAGKPGAALILLCADDPNRAIGIREGLGEFGFVTDFAHARADAITRAAATSYRAIVVDLDLPNGESMGLVSELRAQSQNGKTAIIGMTADAARDCAATALCPPDDWVNKPVDTDRLAQIIDRAVVREVNGHPQILHVDDDPHVLKAVARALGTTATVTSVDSLESARKALAARQFDLAVLDVGLGPVSGLELLPQLRGRAGHALPVIIFSAQGANTATDPRVQASLSKSPAGLDRLVATVHDRLTPHAAPARREIV